MKDKDLSLASELPQHIAVIMDGNGRWAKNRGLPRIAGHKKGVDMVRSMIIACRERNIPYLTLFAFSSENWKRPKTEVSLLMDLFVQAIDNEISKLNENDICFRIIGDKTRFGKKLNERINAAEDLTRENKSLILNIAANYGGRWDLVQATKKIAEDVAKKVISLEEIDEEVFFSYLSLAGTPEPDLFIRTGGEHRISNFLLWDLAYTELYFTDTIFFSHGVTNNVRASSAVTLAT